MDNLAIIHGLSTEKWCFLFVSMDNLIQEKKESSHSGALALFLNHDKCFRACATKLAFKICGQLGLAFRQFVYPITDGASHFHNSLLLLFTRNYSYYSAFHVRCKLFRLFFQIFLRNFYR